MATLEVSTEISKITAYFQPIMDLENWRVAGVEALARTETGESAFPLLARAKQEGWYEQIELPLVKIAMRQSQHLPLDLLVTVNISEKTVFNPELERLIDTFPCRAWGLEILEDSKRIKEFQTFKKRVDELGCALLIDDAGEGNSDELRIHHLQPSVVKIDRNLLLRAMHGSRARNRLESIIKESRASSALLLAEGVETVDQLNFASELGCEYAQGWYFSQAVPAQQIEQQIRELEQRLWIDAP